MKNNTVVIQSNPEAYCLTVLFVDHTGGTVKTFKFYNFVGNGDLLSAAIANWVDNGISPNQIKGLVEVI